MTTIEQTIAKLRQLVQLEVQHRWRDLTLLSVVNISSSLAKVNLQECPTASVNDRGYLVFPQGKQIIWLAQKITIPQTLQGYPVSGLSLRLVLTWWAEDARIFIDGELVQQGDLFDSSARVLISENALPGREYLVTICLVTPNHDIGALMRSHLLYESQITEVDPGLVADELTVLYKYLSQFEPEHLDVLAAELDRFNWHNLQNADRFESDLAKLRSSLLPLAKNIKQRCFNLLGHAHLDMAWLWTTDETYEVAERTFRSVLGLQQDFPTLTFGHTSPALYEWMENNRPKLFAAIDRAARSNQWEILGGMWIEPETNLVSGESLIRQLLHGQEYYQRKFDKVCQVAWLPDSFGFTWQLPQIMQQCGIEYFVTGKLHWNDTTEFPHGCFWWESPDGTRLLTLMSPPNVTGVMDTNPITMADYAIKWETQTDLQDIFWLPGVGDHGGGPTRDMLEIAAKWNHSPFFPEIKFSTAADYLTKISESSFPVWQDELYLELHRGCYTVHAEQKKYNRYCERLLYQAELWSTLATLLCKDRFVSEPLFSNIVTILEKEDFCQANWRREALKNSLCIARKSVAEISFDELIEQEASLLGQQLIEVAWKKVLFNQFHDILPGTSIPEVFAEADRDWKAAIEIGEHLLQSALKAIASKIVLPEPPQPYARAIVVFNSLNWQRSAVVTLATEEKYYQIYDLDGDLVPSQVDSEQLSFLAENIPAIGYRTYWLLDSESESTIDIDRNNFILENDWLKVVVNRNTGNLDSIYDKQEKLEILSGSGNKLEAFEDKGQYWDAWNIDPKYEQKQLPDTKLQSIAWVEAGAIRQTIRVIKQLNCSQFIQDYILDKNSPILKIANTVDWQETQVMVKASFPLNIQSDFVTYEIPCGAMQQTTKPQSAAERAKWEVPALNWADLTDDSAKYGASLLNDCKYGYDFKPNQLRLTLLRAPLWPDPQSDRGTHHFTYAIYPHKNSWQEANTVHRGYELNTPLQTVMLERDLSNQNLEKLLPTGELLNLSADNLILMALKFSNHRELVLRCYEAHGTEAKLNLQSDLNLQLAKVTNGLEVEDLEFQLNDKDKIEPYKIKTFKLNFGE